MSFTCKYCNSNLSSVSYLNSHQKNTKKCLVIQGLLSSKRDNVNLDEFKCEICNNTFTTKNNLSTHHKKCKEKNINFILLKEKIIEVETKNKILSEDNIKKNEL